MSLDHPLPLFVGGGWPFHSQRGHSGSFSLDKLFLWSEHMSFDCKCSLETTYLRLAAISRIDWTFILPIASLFSIMTFGPNIQVSDLHSFIIINQKDSVLHIDHEIQPLAF